MIAAIERFSGLRKLAREPAARLLAMSNVTLDTPLSAPASASVEVVLAELADQGATLDMLRLLAVALPVRERVWWACLAGRDTLAAGAEPPPPLRAAEAWVFRPTEENRIAVRDALAVAAVDDDTVHCATGVIYCDGTLGPGDLAQHAAPPGASALCAFAMNVIALGAHPEEFDAFGRQLVERALDIARGGSGRVDGHAAEAPA